MAVSVMQNGIPVTLSERLWSFDANLQVIGSSASVTSYLGGDLRDPDYVWRTQRSVRTVIGFLARNIASVSMHGFKRAANGDKERLDDTSKLATALRNPAGPTMSAGTEFEFVKQLATDYKLWDRYAALKLMTNEGPAMMRLPPRRWKFERDGEDKAVAVLWLRADGTVKRYELDKLLWLDAYATGVYSTPMDQLFDLLTEQQESGAYRTSLWENGARVPGWIERPSTAPPWSKTARDNFRTGWQGYAKDGVKSGKTPILEDDMKYHEAQNGVTPEAAQQLEARKLSLAEVSAAFYLPPVFAGLLDNANFSNVEAFRAMLYEDVLGVDFQEIQQAINARWVPEVAEPGEFAEFNVAEKLRMSFEKQASILQTAVGGPYMTRNEARRKLNLPEVPEGDELIIPLNVIIGGQASPTDSAPK